MIAAKHRRREPGLKLASNWSPLGATVVVCPRDEEGLAVVMVASVAVTVVVAPGEGDAALAQRKHRALSYQAELPT